MTDVVKNTGVSKTSVLVWEGIMWLLLGGSALSMILGMGVFGRSILAEALASGFMFMMIVVYAVLEATDNASAHRGRPGDWVMYSATLAIPGYLAAVACGLSWVRALAAGVGWVVLTFVSSQVVAVLRRSRARRVQTGNALPDTTLGRPAETVHAPRAPKSGGRVAQRKLRKKGRLGSRRWRRQAGKSRIAAGTRRRA